MEEAYQIADYLPVQFKDPNEQEYITFLFESFESNYQEEKYAFSFLAFHMLFMSFIYFNVWQIKSIRNKDFDMIKIGFKREFHDANTPFRFSLEQESKIFDLLEYLCSGHTDIRSLITACKNLVKDRNSIAHANGKLQFRKASHFENRIANILEHTETIQGYSKEIIQEQFERFLIESQHPDEREYSILKDQLNEILIHQNYLSQKDIDFCLAYEINVLKDQPNYKEIQLFYQKLKEQYGAVE